MNKNILIAIVAVLVLAGGFIFYQNSKTQTTTPVTTVDVSTPSSSPTSQSTSSATTGETKEFSITGANFKFDPATITVNKGDTVKINFKSAGGTHNFVLSEFNVKTDIIGSDKTETVEFTASKSGTFEYYCSVGNHRAMGMVGQLVVQ